MVDGKQLIATWMSPKSFLPRPGKRVVLTIHNHYGTKLVVGWYDVNGWNIDGFVMGAFEVVAWCDLNTYGKGTNDD